MSPQAALDHQIERYRKMTGEERLAIALDLHELSCDIAREGHPGTASGNGRGGSGAAAAAAAGTREGGVSERELLIDCLRRLNHAENLRGSAPRKTCSFTSFAGIKSHLRIASWGTRQGSLPFKEPPWTGPICGSGRPNWMS